MFYVMCLGIVAQRSFLKLSIRVSKLVKIKMSTVSEICLIEVDSSGSAGYHKQLSQRLLFSQNIQNKKHTIFNVKNNIQACLLRFLLDLVGVSALTPC